MECFWSDLSKHPQCPHGPTLLFGTYENGKLEKFYVCAACRERKMCKFYLKENEKLTKQQAAKWEQEKKQFVNRYHHRPLYVRFNEIMYVTPENRCYCHTCEQLIFKTEKDMMNNHKNHDIKEGLTDYEMKHPTEILKPLENSRQEAQYFFTKQSTEDIVNILVKLKAKQILCICTPKIHEYILEHHEDTISSLLLDFDGRFHNFFGPLDYCWYNLLNNHFFNESAAHVFKDFLMQNGGKDTYLVCDPPFGSRVEPISWTIKKISELHKKWNNIEDENNSLKVMFIFPYFMESVMKQKSNPPGISGGLKDLNMTDYKVTYNNHPLFITDTKTTKIPSPIRIFTNVSLNLVKLPEAHGYRFCKKCQKWVAKENKHCKKCQECTSKNGLTYKHCDICKRCVKPYWKHCETCTRCIVTKHLCGQRPHVVGKCFKCNEAGHTEKECDVDEEIDINTTKAKIVKKRKTSNKKANINNAKKRKIGDSCVSEEDEKNISISKNTTKVSKKLEKKGKKQKISPELKVKTLKKPHLLKMQKNIKLHDQSNGIVNTKKKLRKQQT
ncbi:Zinc finger CCHC domain-containing protein 4 [Eufriesea mexicana]|uniref:Zinc finger CCHC domain-containing protein 4 n=1 Tax=Eufriesea mexicana TaxID=516756 RepID=A0A310STG4_9HYME|nr:PREDICTED: zinc finger CCHC domain-containing protein 4 [Eufriesea mexicana]OAD59919.1 Zinc finger CCHC domain-containing protein 4 [Eufriesea mexicana]